MVTCRSRIALILATLKEFFAPAPAPREAAAPASPEHWREPDYEWAGRYLLRRPRQDDRARPHPPGERV